MEIKRFKPYDKVIWRYKNTTITDYKKWQCDFYSSENEDTIFLIGGGPMEKEEYLFLPYEGNEHLVGTTDEPEEEVRLEEGETMYYCDTPDHFIGYGVADGFVTVTNDSFCTAVGMKRYYAIRFCDFNPEDMEETSKHILCVKNGKIVRYKSNGD